MLCGCKSANCLLSRLLRCLEANYRFLTARHKASFTLRTAPYVDARPRASMYDDVRQRTSTQYTADAKLYTTYRCCQLAQKFAFRRTATDGNAHVLHVPSVVVRQRSVCVNAACRKQRVRLQRRRTSPYVV